MELNISGKWWFPDENIQQPGTLIFDDQRALLIISGSFLPTMGTYKARHKKDFIILGELADGRKVTLISYHGGNKQETLGQQYIYSSSEFEIKFIILGTHFQNVQDIRLESCLIEYSSLANWIRFESDNKTLSIRNDEQRVLWSSYNKPIDIVVENVCSMQILPSQKVSYEQYTNESEVNEKVYVKFDKLRNDTLEECLDLTGTVRDFLNFAISDDVKMLTFRGVVKNESDKIDSETVEVLWKSPISANLEKGSKKSCHFRFHEIRGELNRLINAWFDFKSKLTIVYDLYFGVMYNSELYLTNKFLMISEAIEVYHALKLESTDLTKPERALYNRIMPYIKNLPNISNDVTVKDIETVIKWLSNGKMPSLRSRIMELYEKYSDIIPFLSIKIGEKNCFAQKVSNYRNGLTHGTISYEEIDDSDLFWTYMDLQLLLRLCILSQLGFPIEKIQTICHTKSNKPQYSFKEIRIEKKKIALEFFDRNTETAYSWSTQLTDRCNLPESYANDPDLLLKVIHGVQNCIEKERESDIGEIKQEGHEYTEDELSNFLYPDLEKLENTRKNKFFDNIYSINNQDLKNLDGKDEIVGVSLALWSGCQSASKTLSKEENGGPKQEIRGTVFQMIEKISSERPIFGKGVEVALLGMFKQGQDNDIDFTEEVIEPRIRKYENLWNQRVVNS